MIVYGINPVIEALRCEHLRVERVFITEGKSGGRLASIRELAARQKVAVQTVTAQVIEKQAGSAHHQDVAARLSGDLTTDAQSLITSQARLLLLLDGVEDPHNLGAVLRSAEAVGVDGVLLPGRRSCGITPAVVKSSAGAALHLKTAVIGNAVQTLEELKRHGFWVVGLDMSGTTSPEELDTSLPLVVVVGGEHRGVRPLVRRHCDFLVSLPMKGKVSSLNLSVAAAVLLYQILLKRRRQDPPASG